MLGVYLVISGLVLIVVCLHLLANDKEFLKGTPPEDDWFTFVLPVEPVVTATPTQSPTFYDQRIKRFVPQRQNACSRCGGSGYWNDLPHRICFRCNGSGVEP